MEERLLQRSCQNQVGWMDERTGVGRLRKPAQEARAGAAHYRGCWGLVRRAAGGTERLGDTDTLRLAFHRALFSCLRGGWTVWDDPALTRLGIMTGFRREHWLVIGYGGEGALSQLGSP